MLSIEYEQMYKLIINKKIYLNIEVNLKIAQQKLKTS